MYQQQRMPIKTYDIHPTSIKLIKQGHPWITMDKFSEKFHPKEKFIVAADKSRPLALLIHDPTHKNIRARVWSTSGNFPQQMKGFKNELAQRLNKSIKKRFEKKITEERQNFYLVFGEGDLLPGIFIQYLNGEVLIQYYMDFWKQFQDFLVQTVVKSVQQYFSEDLTRSNVWIQQRTTEHKKEALCLDPNTTFKNIIIEEFGVKYKVTIGKYYDHGIYTDMSAIRKRIQPHIEQANSVLNLYSYTGAFSLYALKSGAEKVVSVDLSEPYIDWLKENISLNEDFKAESHEAIIGATKEALTNLSEKNESFDLIISDPPSSSSDGKKRTNALNDYEENLVKFDQLLSDEGEILAFLNTHKSTFRKFEDKLKQIISNKSLQLRVIKRFYLQDDCPTIKGFPEGTYLKGILLKRGTPEKYTPSNKKAPSRNMNKKKNTRWKKPKAPIGNRL